MKLSTAIMIFGVYLANSVHLQGAVLWDEETDGPLSGNFENPSMLPVFVLGTNTVKGSVRATPFPSGWSVQEDLFTFTVPATFQVASAGLSLDGTASAWIGTPDFLTEYHFAITPVGGDLLSFWGAALLPGGTYGMYVGNSDLQSVPTVVQYRLDFVVIPEPTTGWLALGGFGLLWFARRRGCRRLGSNGSRSRHH